LRKNEIIVLDEATANVDLQTDEFIQKKIAEKISDCTIFTIAHRLSTIAEKFSDCTIFTIAHRLSTIANYDKVLIMDKGIPVEFDSPFKLLVNDDEDEEITRNGHFASIVLKTGLRTSD